MRPEHVRIANAQDANQLFALVAESENEWTLLPRNYDKVRRVILTATDPEPLLDAEGNEVFKPVFGVIDGEDGIVAACGLYPTQLWDSDHYYLYGFLHYARVAARKVITAPLPGLGTSLMEFGNWFADDTDMPIIWVLMHEERLPAKQRLMARKADKIGGLFMHRPGVEIAKRRAA